MVVRIACQSSTKSRSPPHRRSPPIDVYSPGPPPLRPEDAHIVDYDERDLRTEPPGVIAYLASDAPIDRAAWFRDAERQLKAYLIRERTADVLEALRRFAVRSGERRVEVAAEGKPALTEFRMLTSFAAATLMEAKPATGRTHQIRVHATESGHPLLGDDKYHNATSLALSKQLGVRRLCLHAAALQFNHPETGATLFVKAPADEAFKAVLARLEAGG